MSSPPANALQESVRELKVKVGDLDQSIAVFKQETAAVSSELRETEETLKACDYARGELSSMIEKLTHELTRWKDNGKALKARLAEIEKSLRQRDDALERVQKQYEDACRLLAEQSQAQQELERSRREFDSQRACWMEVVKKERDSAEAVRREGVEALEQAREMERRAKKSV